MQTNYEKTLQKEIFNDLIRGREGWDLPHTKAVVYYVKKILKSIKDNPLDKEVLIISAYAHDWGYKGLFENKKSNNYEEIRKMKDNHMKIGSELVKQLLKKDEFKFIDIKRKKRIIHLVKIHDETEFLNEIDEKVLMEADTLGGLDTNFVTPNLSYEDNKKYMQKVLERRFPLFITDYSKKRFKILFKKRELFYSK